MTTARDGARGDASRPESEPAEPERISVWEWVSGAIGLLVVVAALTMLLRDAFAPSSPPDISVRLDSVSAGRSAYVVHFSAENAGREPAAAVTVEGLLSDGRDTLVSTVTIDYLPGRSTRRGGLLFPVDPRMRELRMRAVGFEDP